MRKPLAKLMFIGVIFAIGIISNSPAAFSQGFLKRLQDRVHALDEQDAGAEDLGAAKPTGPAPRAGAQRANQRRPLVDALLQYGPEIFGGQETSKDAAFGAPGERGRAAGMFTQPRPSGDYQKASLGIDVLESAPGVPGVLVTGFRNDSEADDAGLQENDVIVSLDETLTPKIADIAKFLAVHRPGELVTARVLRGDQMKTIRIPLLGTPKADSPARRPSGANMFNPSIASSPVSTPSVTRAPAAQPPVQGRGVSETLAGGGLAESLPAPVTQPPMQFSTNTGVQRYGILLASGTHFRGALVDGVVSGSAADVAGIKPADRVVSVDGLLIKSNVALIRQLSNLTQGTVASLGLVRGDSYVIAAMRLTTELKSDAAASGQQLNAQKQQAANAGSMETETGVLEGIGSVLGGLLGGAGKNTGKAEAEAFPPKPGEKLKSREAVQQTSFEQKVSGQLEKMVGDPPSLNGLSAKRNSKTTANVTDAEEPEQTAAEMREKIRQLQEKLKQMEQQSQGNEKHDQQKIAPASKTK